MLVSFIRQAVTAVVVIGGLVSATAMTLLVAPRGVRVVRPRSRASPAVGDHAMIITRPRMTVVAVVGLLAMAWTWPAASNELLLDRLLADLEGFSGRHVEIAGHVEHVRTGSSRRGRPQYTFDLSDGVRSIMIFGSGPPPCRTGTTAVVIGTVETWKRAGQLAGWIDAVEVSCR